MSAASELELREIAIRVATEMLSGATPQLLMLAKDPKAFSSEINTLLENSKPIAKALQQILDRPEVAPDIAPVEEKPAEPAAHGE